MKNAITASVYIIKVAILLLILVPVVAPARSRSGPTNLSKQISYAVKHITSGDQQYRLGNLQMSEIEYKMSLSHFPMNLGANLGLAKIMLKINNREEALKYFSRVYLTAGSNTPSTLARSRQNLEAKYEYAQLLKTDGDTRTAWILFTEIVQTVSQRLNEKNIPLDLSSSMDPSDKARQALDRFNKAFMKRLSK